MMTSERMGLLLVVALCGAACTAAPPRECKPTLDLCNGLDDDCDGQVDEGFGVGEPCTVGVGACQAHGYLRCAADGLSAVCDAAPGLPSPEICNGIDDDCNGLVDDGLTGCCVPGEHHACGAATDVGVCLAGTETCGADSTWPGTCLDAAGQPVVFPGARVELCNGVDDDCDGQVDEGFNAGQPCSAGVGACHVEGTMVCSADGRSTACSVVAGSPTAEVCNGLDDDCNGVVDDEGAVGCTSYWLDADADGYGTGSPRCLCAPTGAWTATAGGDCNDANAAIHPGAPERCNGIDDDCNGLVDDGLDVGGWCSVGVGACQRWAQKVCGTDGSVLCPATAALPSPETCNGVDDDCDGAADDASVLAMCGTVPPGRHAQPDVVSCSGQYTPRCVLACDPGWYDMNAQVPDGCECQPDADDLAGLGNDCHNPINLGSLLPNGVVLERTGTVVPDDDADHFVFTSSAAGAGTYPWPNSPGEYGWWICVRLDPAFQSKVSVQLNGTGGTPIPICSQGSNSGGGGCFNNPNGQVRTYNIRIDRSWSAPMECTLDAGKDTAAYRLQVKGYKTEPVYPYTW